VLSVYSARIFQQHQATVAFIDDIERFVAFKQKAG